MILFAQNCKTVLERNLGQVLDAILDRMTITQCSLTGITLKSLFRTVNRINKAYFLFSCYLLTKEWLMMKVSKETLVIRLSRAMDSQRLTLHDGSIIHS